jgi:putative peptidoglycan lipid II flippase
VLWGLAVLLAAPLAGGGGPRIAALAALVAAGLVSFALFAQISGAARLGEVRLLARPRRQEGETD